LDRRAGGPRSTATKSLESLTGLPPRRSDTTEEHPAVPDPVRATPSHPESKDSRFGDGLGGPSPNREYREDSRRPTGSDARVQRPHGAAGRPDVPLDSACNERRRFATRQRHRELSRGRAEKSTRQPPGPFAPGDGRTRRDARSVVLVVGCTRSPAAGACPHADANARLDGVGRRAQTPHSARFCRRASGLAAPLVVSRPFRT
jgi:hypothetical protein